MWETLQTLGMLNLFCSPTMTGPESSANPSRCHFGSSTVPSLGAPLPLVIPCAAGDLQVVTQDKRISPGFLMAMHNFWCMQPSRSSSTWLLGSSSAQAAETGICRQEAGGGYTYPTMVGALGNCCQRSQYLWGKASDCHSAETHSNEGKAQHKVMAVSDVCAPQG